MQGSSLQVPVLGHCSCQQGLLAVVWMLTTYSVGPVPPMAALVAGATGTIATSDMATIKCVKSTLTLYEPLCVCVRSREPMITAHVP